MLRITYIISIFCIFSLILETNAFAQEANAEIAIAPDVVIEIIAPDSITVNSDPFNVDIWIYNFENSEVTVDWHNNYHEPGSFYWYSCHYSNQVIPANSIRVFRGCHIPHVPDAIGTWSFRARIYDDYWGTIDIDTAETVVY
ncbi:MAG: hypothetical protein ACE5OP_09455 [Candidatus Glassbacteria bacterium]